MKVLQINAVLGFGSTGIIVKDVGDMLEREGHEAYYAYQSSSYTPKRGFKIGNKLDWKYHALYTRIFGKQAYASKRATKALLKWIDGVKPDVVHLHNLHSNYINLNMLCDYLAENNVPTVITMHDCWYFTGKCTHYLHRGCERWRESCGACPQLKSEVSSWIFDNTSKVLSDRTSHLNKIPSLTLVGCSKWIANEAKKSRLNGANIDFVYNGVDTSVFTPHESDIRAELGIGADDFVIIGMANKWSQPENADTVDKIINEFSSIAKILIVGCTDAQISEYKEKYPGVITVGYVKDRQRLSDVYAVSDVFVNLTHVDTLPTVNMESICSGTPVITFASAGSPELVDPDSGIVVPIGDTNGVLDAIRSIKNNVFSYDVKEKQIKFDKEKNYDKYLEIYKNVSEKK